MAQFSGISRCHRATGGVSRSLAGGPQLGGTRPRGLDTVTQGAPLVFQNAGGTPWWTRENAGTKSRKIWENAGKMLEHGE